MNTILHKMNNATTYGQTYITFCKLLKSLQCLIPKGLVIKKFYRHKKCLLYLCKTNINLIE